MNFNPSCALTLIKERSPHWSCSSLSSWVPSDLVAPVIHLDNLETAVKNTLKCTHMTGWGF